MTEEETKLVAATEDVDLVYKAGLAYTAYCSAVGGVAWNNDPLPTWDEFRADPTKVKQYLGWIASTRAILLSIGYYGEDPEVQ